MFNTVILYHYTINNDYTRYNICSAWILDNKNINMLLLLLTFLLVLFCIVMQTMLYV